MRVHMYQNWVAFRTILTKEVLRFMRIWVQTIMPPAINALLYLLIFGTLLGERVGTLEGHSYMDFIVPGIIMMSIIINSYSNVVSSFFSAKFHNNVEELLISPVHNFVILAGYILGGVARGVVVGATVAVVSLLFTDIHVVNPVTTIIVTLLTAIMFSLGGFINAVYARNFDDVAIVPSFVLTPLTYLGGIFYSIQLLPEFWQNVSLLNPVLYMINGFRYGILGVSDIGISLTYAVLFVFIAGLGGTAMYLLNKGIGIKE